MSVASVNTGWSRSDGGRANPEEEAAEPMLGRVGVKCASLYHRPDSTSARSRLLHLRGWD